MSQQKVDKYKEAKANRQQIIKKEKRVRRLEYTAIIVVLAAAVGWIGFSVYSKAQSSAPAKQYVMDTSAIDEYVYSIGGEDEEELDLEDLEDLEDDLDLEDESAADEDPDTE